MNLNLKNINENEILKYLNYRGGEVPKDVDILIDDCIKEIESIFSGGYRYLVFNRDEDILKRIIKGQDAENLLTSSDKIILMVASLGAEVEKRIGRYNYSDMVKAVVLDATASAGIECMINDLYEELKEKYKPLYLTDRFSPGYGDMPLDVQEDLLKILEADKFLGVKMTSSKIMIPGKSISAICGISKNKQKYRHRGCENCRLFRECEFVKRNEVCAYAKG